MLSESKLDLFIYDMCRMSNEQQTPALEQQVRALTSMLEACEVGANPDLTDDQNFIEYMSGLAIAVANLFRLPVDERHDYINVSLEQCNLPELDLEDEDFYSAFEEDEEESGSSEEDELMDYDEQSNSLVLLPTSAMAATADQASTVSDDIIPPPIEFTDDFMPITLTGTSGYPVLRDVVAKVGVDISLEHHGNRVKIGKVRKSPVQDVKPSHHYRILNLDPPGVKKQLDLSILISRGLKKLLRGNSLAEMPAIVPGILALNIPSTSCPKPSVKLKTFFQKLGLSTASQ